MSPRGLKDGVAEGTGTVNKKIYYSAARPREGANRDRCSQELAVRYGKTDVWGGSVRRERIGGSKLWPVSTPSQRAEELQTELCPPRRLKRESSPSLISTYVILCPFMTVQQNLNEPFSKVGL